MFRIIAVLIAAISLDGIQAFAFGENLYRVFTFGKKTHRAPVEAYFELFLDVFLVCKGPEEFDIKFLPGRYPSLWLTSDLLNDPVLEHSVNTRSKGPVHAIRLLYRNGQDGNSGYLIHLDGDQILIRSKDNAQFQLIGSIDRAAIAQECRLTLEQGNHSFFDFNVPILLLPDVTIEVNRSTGDCFNSWFPLSTWFARIQNFSVQIRKRKKQIHFLSTWRTYSFGFNETDCKNWTDPWPEI